MVQLTDYLIRIITISHQNKTDSSNECDIDARVLEAKDCQFNSLEAYVISVTVEVV